MIYRRKTYRVLPEQVDRFTAFFEKFLLPNQLKHGARLIGRYVTEAQDEIVAIWEYESHDACRRIQEAVRYDDMHRLAEARRADLEPLYLDSREDFLESTGHYASPQHIVGVSGFIIDSQGRVLLVKTHWRSDTWEMPGGQVEEGEPLHEALQREVREEAGVEVRLTGVSGVYQNAGRSIVTVVFRCEAVGGEPLASGETQEAGFFAVNAANAASYVTRPHFRSRLLDALAGKSVPFEAFRVRPHQLLKRLEGCTPDGA